MRGFSGVIDYDWAELVLTAGAGTPLAEIEVLLAQRNQMLAFEPFDHGPIFGATAGMATIGGVIAAGVAGSQRVTQGGARDHLLGFQAVSGHGERFVAGAKVVKNVTGFDLPKLAAGSWGRLFAMTEVTLKVLPAPRARLTKLLEGIDFNDALGVMSAALGSQADVAAAAYLPSHEASPARLAIRIQGFGPSVAARAAMLDNLMGRFGAVHTASEEEADVIWGELRLLTPLRSAGPLWRINVAASRSPTIVAALIAVGAVWLADWGGGLIWATVDGNAQELRGVVEAARGHATLVRAPEEMRLAVPALHPQPKGVVALEERIRRSFDPDGVFETGRFQDIVE